MSGITGIFNRDGRPVNPNDLNRMVDTIAHRGPDGSGIWHDGSVGFTHRMMWTTPESLHEKLPFYRSDADVAITADARIDNRDELMDALGIQKRTGITITDSELILETYLKWGEKTPEKLLGDFVFVIWDGRKRCLFCARDPMGVKTLYYYLSDKYFVFASEIKGILCINDIPRQINELRIAEFIVREINDAVSTFYKDIFAFSAAHWMIITCGAVRKQLYWSPNPETELRLSSDQEYAEAFRTVFFDAVGCRLRSAFPVGSTLSGGMDSSSISCVARDILNSRKQSMLHTFSGIFPGLSNEERRNIDERPYMQSVVDMGGIVPHNVIMDTVSPLVDIDKILFHLDEPHAAGNMYLHWEFFKEARKSGVRILLDGTDGDTTVSYGFDYLTELTRSFRARELIKEAKNLSRVCGWSVKKILREYSIKPFIPDWIQSLIERPIDKKTIYQQCINPDFSKQVGLGNHLNKYRNKYSQRGSLLRVGHCQAILMPIYSLIFALLDQTSRHFGIEMRYPFFDKRLIEFCVALPSDQKFSHGWNRGIMRRALEGVLPPRVQWRTGKADLSANFNRNLSLINRNAITDMLVSNNEIIQQFYISGYYNRLCQSYFLRPQSHPQEAVVIFFSIILSQWIGLIRKKNLDGDLST